MTSRYRATLNEWAARYIPDGAKVVDVRIDFTEGFSTECTVENGSLDVTIVYLHDGERRTKWAVDGDAACRLRLRPGRAGT